MTYTKTKMVEDKRWDVDQFDDVTDVLIREVDREFVVYELMDVDPYELTLVYTRDDGTHHLLYLEPYEESRIYGVRKDYRE